MVEGPGTPGLPFRPDLIVLDFDGVFTDNRVYLDENGVESVVCSRSDGLAISLVREKVRMVILSTETNSVVAKRAEKLKIECYHGVSDKRRALEDLCASLRIGLDKVVYVGNDINDLEAMRICGYSVVPADAHPRVKAEANHVLDRRGGDGVVREFFEVF